jgi:hypothetical protein
MIHAGSLLFLGDRLSLFVQHAEMLFKLWKSRGRVAIEVLTE